MQAIAQHEFSTHLPAEVSESKAKPQLELSDLRKRKSEAEKSTIFVPLSADCQGGGLTISELSCLGILKELCFTQNDRVVT